MSRPVGPRGLGNMTARTRKAAMILNAVLLGTKAKVSSVVAKTDGVVVVFDSGYELLVGNGWRLYLPDRLRPCRQKLQAGRHDG